MSEIKNLEQLRAVKSRLKAELKESEQNIRNEFDYFNSHLQPIFNLVDFSKSKASPLTSGIAKLALPLLVGKIVKSAKLGTKTSIWGMAATLAAEYLIKNVNLNGIGSKISNLISRVKHKI